MNQTLRWTPEQLKQHQDAQRLARRRGLDPIEIVGTANASDRKFVDVIPTLKDAVAGPGVKPKRVRRSKETSPYFQRLCALLRPHGIPDPTPEFKFHPDRLWRADFCWQKPVALMLEVDGGLFVNGGHNRGAALLAQYEKQNAAVLLGYRVLRYSPDQIALAARDIRIIFGR